MVSSGWHASTAPVNLQEIIDEESKNTADEISEMFDKLPEKPTKGTWKIPKKNMEILQEIIDENTNKKD